MAGLGEFLSRLASGLQGAKQLSDAIGMTETVKPDLRGATMSVANVTTIQQRVGIIAGLIKKGYLDPEIIAGARALVSQKCGKGADKAWCIKERDWRGEVVAVFNGTRKDVRWTRDPEGTDFFSHPKYTLKMGGGDCDECIGVLGARLRAIGYPIELIVVETVNAPVKGEMEHIFLAVGWQEEDGEWHAMFLDPSMDKPAGWRVPYEITVRELAFPVD